MTFQQIEYFLEVYKAGSFSEAARKLFVTTPSISIAINNLEKELGCALFVRTQKGLILTETGSKVLEHFSHIAERYRQMTKIKNVAPRALRIAAEGHPACAAAFTRLIQEIKPQLDGNITISATSHHTIQKLFLFELDVAIIGNYHARQLPLFETLEEKGLVYQVLKTVPVEIVIGEKHPLYHQENISPMDFAQGIFLDNILRMTSRNHYLKGILNIPKENVIAVHKEEVLYRLLEEGSGYTIFTIPAPDVCKEHKFRRIPLDNVFYDLISVVNPTRPLNALGQRFLELVKEEFQR